MCVSCSWPSLKHNKTPGKFNINLSKMCVSCSWPSLKHNKTTGKFHKSFKNVQKRAEVTVGNRNNITRPQVNFKKVAKRAEVALGHR